MAPRRVNNLDRARRWTGLLLLVPLATAPIMGAVALGIGAPASADDNQDLARRLKEAGDILPLETLLAQARTLYPEGRVIETELQRRDGHWVYEIELLDRGVVHELRYDARTGRLLAAQDK